MRIENGRYTITSGVNYIRFTDISAGKTKVVRKSSVKSFDSAFNDATSAKIHKKYHKKYPYLTREMDTPSYTQLLKRNGLIKYAVIDNDVYLIDTSVDKTAFSYETLLRQKLWDTDTIISDIYAMPIIKISGEIENAPEVFDMWDTDGDGNDYERAVLGENTFDINDFDINNILLYLDDDTINMVMSSFTSTEYFDSEIKQPITTVINRLECEFNVEKPAIIALIFLSRLMALYNKTWFTIRDVNDVLYSKSLASYYNIDTSKQIKAETEPQPQYIIVEVREYDENFANESATSDIFIELKGLTFDTVKELYAKIFPKLTIELINTRRKKINGGEIC